MSLKICAPRPILSDVRMLAIGVAVVVVAGCTQQPPLSATVPPHAAAHIQPPDWFHRQLAAARAAKRAHQPSTDTAGAQQAYDEILKTACTRAALGPNKYPTRCDTVLRPASTQLQTDPCEANADDPAIQTECND